MGTKSARLARTIERDLAALCFGLPHYFDEQIASIRDPQVLPHSAETGVTFKIRGAAWPQGQRPHGYVVLREERTLHAPDRPRLYWYGLVDRLSSGARRYEGFHCHPEKDPSELDCHFQVEIDDTTVHKEPWPYIHPVRAIERLMERYYGRLEMLEDEDE